MSELAEQLILFCRKNYNLYFGRKKEEEGQ